MHAGDIRRFEPILPESARFWIRHAPVRWPGPAGWWIDLARAEPASANLKLARIPQLGEQDFDDVVYIPPLASAAELSRQELVQRCAELGVPVVQQILPDDPVPVGVGLVVIDLTEALLKRRLPRLRLPAGVWAAWPLISGLTDDEAAWNRSLSTLASQGIAGVAPVALSLDPSLRRELAEFGSAKTYSGLFHGDEQASVVAMSRAVAAAGLPVLPPRPKLADGRRSKNRHLAGHFALVAELWLRCGRAEGRAQEFFRASRRLEDEPLDVGELARRGSLAVVEWLDGAGREEIEQLANGESSALRDELERELYRSGDVPSPRAGRGEEEL